MEGSYDGNTFSEEKKITILSLPDEILDTLMSYTTYDEISRFRLVCRKFNSAAQRVLNQGFYKVEKYHAQCLRKVKEQLPRRESERRKHPLSVHCDILTSIETRLSLLGMTFMKYVELKHCCFIPGKVLDEIFKVLRLVSTVSVLPKAHDILLELRDISSMAMEHFDEKVAPAFRARSSPKPKLVVTLYGTLAGNSSSGSSTHSTPTSLLSTPSSLEIAKLRVAMKQQNFKCLELKKENVDVKHKLTDHRRKLQEFDRRLLDQNNILIQQNTRIADQDRKILEEERKGIEQERKIVQMEKKLLEQDKKIHEMTKKIQDFIKSSSDEKSSTTDLKNVLMGDSIPESSDPTTIQIIQTNSDNITTDQILSKSESKKGSVLDGLCSLPLEGMLTRRKRQQQQLALKTDNPNTDIPLLTDITILKKRKIDKPQRNRQQKKS